MITTEAEMPQGPAGPLSEKHNSSALAYSLDCPNHQVLWGNKDSGEPGRQESEGPIHQPHPTSLPSGSKPKPPARSDSLFGAFVDGGNEGFSPFSLSSSSTADWSRFWDHNNENPNAAKGHGPNFDVTPILVANSLATLKQTSQPMSALSSGPGRTVAAKSERASLLPQVLQDFSRHEPSVPSSAPAAFAPKASAAPTFSFSKSQPKSTTAIGDHPFLPSHPIQSENRHDSKAQNGRPKGKERKCSHYISDVDENQLNFNINTDFGSPSAWLALDQLRESEAEVKGTTPVDNIEPDLDVGLDPNFCLGMDLDLDMNMNLDLALDLDLDWNLPLDPSQALLDPEESLFLNNFLSCPESVFPNSNSNKTQTSEFSRSKTIENQNARFNPNFDATCPDPAGQEKLNCSSTMNIDQDHSGFTTGQHLGHQLGTDAGKGGGGSGEGGNPTSNAYHPPPSLAWLIDDPPPNAQAILCSTRDENTVQNVAAALQTEDFCWPEEQGGQGSGKVASVMSPLPPSYENLPPTPAASSCFSKPRSSFASESDGRVELRSSAAVGSASDLGAGITRTVTLSDYPFLSNSLMPRPARRRRDSSAAATTDNGSVPRCVGNERISQLAHNEQPVPTTLSTSCFPTLDQSERLQKNFTKSKFRIPPPPQQDNPRLFHFGCETSFVHGGDGSAEQIRRGENAACSRTPMPSTSRNRPATPFEQDHQEIREGTPENEKNGKDQKIGGFELGASNKRPGSNYFPITIFHYPEVDTESGCEGALSGFPPQLKQQQQQQQQYDYWQSHARSSSNCQPSEDNLSTDLNMNIDMDTAMTLNLNLRMDMGDTSLGKSQPLSPCNNPNLPDLEQPHSTLPLKPPSQLQMASHRLDPGQPDLLAGSGGMSLDAGISANAGMEKGFRSSSRFAFPDMDKANDICGGGMIPLNLRRRMILKQHIKSETTESFSHSLEAAMKAVRTNRDQCYSDYGHAITQTFDGLSFLSFNQNGNRDKRRGRSEVQNGSENTQQNTIYSDLEQFAQQKEIKNRKKCVTAEDTKDGEKPQHSGTSLLSRPNHPLDSMNNNGSRNQSIVGNANALSGARSPHKGIGVRMGGSGTSPGSETDSDIPQDFSNFGYIRIEDEADQRFESYPNVERRREFGLNFGMGLGRGAGSNLELSSALSRSDDARNRRYGHSVKVEKRNHRGFRNSSSAREQPGSKKSITNVSPRTASRTPPHYSPLAYHSSGRSNLLPLEQKNGTNINTNFDISITGQHYSLEQQQIYSSAIPQTEGLVPGRFLMNMEPLLDSDVDEEPELTTQPNSCSGGSGSLARGQEKRKRRVKEAPTVPDDIPDLTAAAMGTSQFPGLELTGSERNLGNKTGFSRIAGESLHAFGMIPPSRMFSRLPQPQPLSQFPRARDGPGQVPHTGLYAHYQHYNQRQNYGHIHSHHSIFNKGMSPAMASDAAYQAGVADLPMIGRPGTEVVDASCVPEEFPTMPFGFTNLDSGLDALTGTVGLMDTGRSLECGGGTALRDEASQDAYNNGVLRTGKPSCATTPSLSAVTAASSKHKGHRRPWPLDAPTLTSVDDIYSCSSNPEVSEFGAGSRGDSEAPATTVHPSNTLFSQSRQTNSHMHGSSHSLLGAGKVTKSATGTMAPVKPKIKTSVLKSCTEMKPMSPSPSSPLSPSSSAASASPTTAQPDPSSKPTPQSSKSKSKMPAAASRSNSTVNTSTTATTTTRRRTRSTLTEAQKRANHIRSEQKRRNQIKTGFEELHQLVPTLRSSSSAFCKSRVLAETSAFIKRLKKGNSELGVLLGLDLDMKVG